MRFFAFYIFIFKRLGAEVWPQCCYYFYYIFLSFYFFYILQWGSAVLTT
jgi:hypothetical protein